MLRKLLALTAIVMFSSVGVAHAQTGASNLPNNGMTAGDNNGAPNQGETGDQITGEAHVYGANTNADVDWLSDPIRMGTFKADANGSVKFSFKVPNVPVGVHTIRVTGTGTDGKALVQSVSYTVTAPAGNNLPKTGTNNSKPIAQIGAGAIAVGGLLVLGSKRRKAKATAA